MSQPQMVHYPGNPGAPPSQMGYYPGPYPRKVDDVVKAELGDARNEWKSLMLSPAVIFMSVGTMLLTMLSIVPIWNAVCLLMDDNYIFWAGGKTPRSMIIFSILIIVLYPVTVATFFSRASRTARTEQIVMLIASIFITLFGLFLMVVSLPLTQQVNLTSTNLLYRCDNSEETHRLYEYANVLLNIRSQPECATKYSVVECAGYEDAPPYTDMLKSMEKNFRCAGFCYKATNSTAASTAKVSTLSVKLEVKKQHRLDGEAQQHSLIADSDMSGSMAGSGEVAMFPPTLFSDSNFQASCEGMAVRGMKNVAGDIGQQTFYQGLYLVLIAVVTGFLKLFGSCVHKS